MAFLWIFGDKHADGAGKNAVVSHEGNSMAAGAGFRHNKGFGSFGRNGKGVVRVALTVSDGDINGDLACVIDLHRIAHPFGLLPMAVTVGKWIVHDKMSV